MGFISSSDKRESKGYMETTDQRSEETPRVSMNLRVLLLNVALLMKEGNKEKEEIGKGKFFYLLLHLYLAFYYYYHHYKYHHESILIFILLHS